MTPESPPASNLLGERTLCRFYLLSTDLLHAHAGYEWLVSHARKTRLAGATVLPAIHGFGSRGIVHPSLWRFTNPTPVIVECVDHPDVIARFLLDTLPQLHHGTITLERAGVLFYRRRNSPDPHKPLQSLARIKNLSTVPTLTQGDAMTNTQFSDGQLLRIFLGSSDSHQGKPLHEAIVNIARSLGLAGATVLRGTMGYGANSVLHSAKLAELSSDLPIVVEIVDADEKITALLRELDPILHEGMVTTESVRLLQIPRASA